MNIIRSITLTIFYMLLAACSMAQIDQHPPLRNVPARQLLLQADAFPPGWMFNPCLDHCKRTEGDEYAERSFFLPSVAGHVVMEVHRSSDYWYIKRKYDRWLEVDFRAREPPNVQFSPPPNGTFQSNFADEYRFGCGIDIVPACEVILRYGNYFVYVYSDLDSGDGEGLKLHEILKILQTLDKQAETKLRP